MDAVADALDADRTDASTSPAMEAARGVIRIANNNMINALKLVSVNRGHDPRDFTLVAFGGGGGMHAVELAAELGIRKVVVPRAADVFSAWGMLMSDLRRDYFVTRLLRVSEADAPKLDALLGEVASEAREEFAREGVPPSRCASSATASLRYENQEHSVEVLLPEGTIDGASQAELADTFHRAYEHEYTYRLAAPIEFVSLHLVALAEVGRLAPAPLPVTGGRVEDARKEARVVDFAASGVHDASIYDGELLEPGQRFAGPAIVETKGSTTVVHPGNTRGRRRLRQSRHLDRRRHVIAPESDPITLEIIQNSLQSISDEMFAAFRKTAMSAIIYEVLDMGTCITDGDGNLASSGAGIPAFVGVLDKAVKRIIEVNTGPDGIRPGDIFATNDPFYGGVTHLNDVVLAMPVFAEGRRVAWTANIAHWNDVGGMVPGSISNDAREIFQEGLRLPAVKLVSEGTPIESVMAIMKCNSRLPDYLEGDMWAGIAAARVGERRVLELIGKYGLGTFLTALDLFMDYGEQVSRRALAGLPKGRYSLAEEQDSGTVYTVTVEIKRRRVRRRPERQPRPGRRAEQRQPRRLDGGGADGVHEHH